MVEANPEEAVMAEGSYNPLEPPTNADEEESKDHGELAEAKKNEGNAALKAGEVDQAI